MILNSSPTKPTTQSGFTLIEIMIALMIASVAVVAIIESMGKTSWVASELEQRVLASWVASNEIAEIRYDAKINRIKEGSDSSSVEMGGLKWKIKSRIKETEVEKVYLVTVEVTDQKRSEDAAFSSMTTAITDRL